MQAFDLPAMLHEVAGEPVEEFGMAGFLAERTEVAGFGYKKGDRVQKRGSGSETPTTEERGGGDSTAVADERRFVSTKERSDRRSLAHAQRAA